MIFLILSSLIFTIVAVIVPKKLPRKELYAIALFSIVMGFTVDITLDLKYHLYGYFEPGVQFIGFLPSLFLFSTTGVVFMNFYPFDKPLINKWFYILCWCIFCLIFELLSLKSGYFYYNGWKLWYSALTYPLLFWIHLLHLKIFRKYTSRQ